MTAAKQDSQSWTTIITPSRRKYYLGLRELIKYRDLVWLFFYRDFTALYKQTILGPAWYLIQPLLTTVVYGFVFGSLAGLGTEGVPQYLFYMSGIVLWRFFADGLQKISTTFQGKLTLVPSASHSCLPICGKITSLPISSRMSLYYLKCGKTAR